MIVKKYTSLDNQKGSALLTATFVITVLCLLLVGLISLSLMESRISANYLAKKQSFYIAEAGLEKFLFDMSSLNQSFYMENQSDTVAEITDNENKIFGTYQISTAKVGLNEYSITSTGTVNNVSATIKVQVKLKKSDKNTTFEILSWEEN